MSTAGDKVTYSATMADGAKLPTWLHLNATTGALSGTPPNTTAVGTVVTVDLTVTDSVSGHAYSAADVIQIDLVAAHKAAFLGDFLS